MAALIGDEDLPGAPLPDQGIFGQPTTPQAPDQEDDLPPVPPDEALPPEEMPPDESGGESWESDEDGSGLPQAPPQP